MHPLACGEWTVLVLHDRFDIQKGESARTTRTDRFYVTFLTHQGGKMRVLDAKAFMEETNSDDFLARWEKAISGLNGPEERNSKEQERFRSAVEVTSCDEETVDNIMALMEMVERGEIT
jgi:hypothetical protein